MITRLDISLEQYDVGMSGAIPNRADWSEPAMDRGILEFAALFSGIVFKYGGRIIHGSHPTFTPIIFRQAPASQRSPAPAGDPSDFGTVGPGYPSSEELEAMTDVAEIVVTKKMGSKGPEDTETRNQAYPQCAAC